jgi:transposase, IS6 family
LIVAGDTEAVIESKSGSSSPPAGYRFPREVIAVAVRWYLRYGLSYRDVEELLTERGIQVDHVTIYRWVQTFTAEFIDAARPARHRTGDRWFVDETYVKVAGGWSYLYRAIDQYGQVIDILLSPRRDGAAARAFLTRALAHGPSPIEITTDRAPVYPRVLGTSWSDTPTTSWKRTTADSKRDYVRCAGLRRSAPHAQSRPATPSCRTSAAATTNSPPTCLPAIVFASHSANSRTASDRVPPRHSEAPAFPAADQRNTALVLYAVIILIIVAHP